MKARVIVTLKSGVLDPQGKAIEGALSSLGVAGIDANLATAVRTSVVVVFTWLLAWSLWRSGERAAQEVRRLL